MFGDFQLPTNLVRRALIEHARDGQINADTAALLIEAGAYPANLEKQVFQQSSNEGTGI